MRALVLAVLFALIVLPASVIAGEFTNPSPDLLLQLQREHGRKDWLRVTTDSARWEVRVREFTPEGLRGLTVRSSPRVAPEIVPWSVIARIDVRTSRFRYGQAMGFVIGGLIGAGVGGALGAGSNHGDVGARNGLAVGVVGGTWLGGYLGDQIVSEHPFYTAAPRKALPGLARSAPGAAGAIAVAETSAGDVPAHDPAADAKAPPLPGVTSSSASSGSPGGTGEPAGAGRRMAVHEADAANEDLPMNAFAAPSPNLLFQLQRSNRRHPWLEVSTDSTRTTLRAGRIDEFGLSELRAFELGASSPAPMPWRQIRKIDERATGARQAGTWGFVLLGAGGAMLGNAIGAPDRQGGTDALIGLGVMGGVGAWLGSRLGERRVHAVPWYVGVPAGPGEAIPPAVATELEPTEPVGVPVEAGDNEESTTTSPDPSDRVLRACKRISPERLLRVAADFGKFQGYAGIIGPQGLEGLRQDRNAHAPYDASAPAELITWDRIDRVEVRASSALYGALMTGAALGSAGGLLAAAVVLGLGGDSAEALGGFGIGFGIAGATGAVIGGLVGAAVPHWQRVYQAR